VRFTRDGVFTLDKDGYLTNMVGDYVMAEAEPPDPKGTLINADGTMNLDVTRVKVAPNQKLHVDEDGRVLIDGQAQYRLVRGMAEDRKAFRKEGDNAYYRAYGEVKRATGNVKPGYVEKPNFSVVEEMAKMIEVSRAYEANAKVIQAHDSLLDKAINSVGPSRR